MLPLQSHLRDRPKGRRGIPSWNLSLVTKTPFELFKEASLKHLAFKNVFLLALGSGKHNSEIPAWLYKTIRHQSDWPKVSLYPSPSFLSKNQLARGSRQCGPSDYSSRGPNSGQITQRGQVPMSGQSTVLLLRQDLRRNKELVFVSFKKGISPGTISSWIKQDLQERYITWHYLLMDQTDCDPML